MEARTIVIIVGCVISTTLSLVQGQSLIKGDNPGCSFKIQDLNIKVQEQNRRIEELERKLDGTTRAGKIFLQYKVQYIINITV